MNGLWDGKNGVWDAAGKIWVQERILWTGAPDAMADTAPPEPTLKVSSGPMSLTCPGSTAGSPCVQAGPPQTASLYIADPWFNTPAHNGAGDGCTPDADATSPVTVRATADASLNYPAGYQAVVVVSDVRDPMVASTQVATRSPPLQFLRTVTCRFSTSSEGGQVFSATVPLQGTIQ